MKKLRKKIKIFNDILDTRKGYILAGIHVGFFMWVFSSLTFIYRGQNLTSALLSSIIWGIAWSIPMFLAGICREWLKNDKKTNELSKNDKNEV
ncbi:hypothetical protein ES705_28742 [subsurface metagenome]